ncbi:MAG: glycerophosphodiester phosphodiesterase family protein [Gammaproteobacteria bacterium]|nr:glycerophosphodiester phosphodiesterase family protein [Gammaproteobacteria bacterium]
MRKLLFLIGLCLPLAACAKEPPRNPDGEPPLVIAHRGAPTLAPENTLAAIRAALDINSPAIEIDIRRSADGVPVLIHDEDLERTTNGEGEVSDFTWEQLRALDAGNWFDERFAGEPIPRLSEALALVAQHPGDSILIVELKDGGDGFEQAVVEAVRASGLPVEKVILKAFERDILVELEKLAPEYPKLYVFVTEIGWMNLVIDEQPRFVDVLEVPEEWLQVHSTFLDRDFVIEAQAAGYKVIAWNVHERELMQEMIDWGVDGIETDYPGELMELLKPD